MNIMDKYCFMCDFKYLINEARSISCPKCGQLNDENINCYYYHSSYNSQSPVLFKINKNFQVLEYVVDQDLFDDKFAFLTLDTIIHEYGSKVYIYGESNIRDYIKSIMVLS